MQNEKLLFISQKNTTDERPLWYILGLIVKKTPKFTLKCLKTGG